MNFKKKTVSKEEIRKKNTANEERERKRERIFSSPIVCRIFFPISSR